jgi:hypothetical protein
MKAYLDLIINIGLIPLPNIFLQIFWMINVGNDTTKENNQAIKRTKKVHKVIEHVRSFRNILCQVKALQQMNQQLGSRTK